MGTSRRVAAEATWSGGRCKSDRKNHTRSRAVPAFAHIFGVGIGLATLNRVVTSPKTDAEVALGEELLAQATDTGDALGILLPEQWFERSSSRSSRMLRLSPVQSLMLAVLEDAIACYDDRDDTRPERRRLAHQAGDWLRSRDTRWLFAFETVCEHLDLEASSVRHRVLAGEVRATNQRRRSTRRVFARRGGPGAQRAEGLGRSGRAGPRGLESIRMLAGAV